MEMKRHFHIATRWKITKNSFDLLNTGSFFLFGRLQQMEKLLNRKFKFIEMLKISTLGLCILFFSFSHLFLHSLSDIPHRFVRLCVLGEKENEMKLFSIVFFLFCKFCTRAAVKRSRKKFTTSIEILLCFCKKIFVFKKCSNRRVKEVSSFFFYFIYLRIFSIAFFGVFFFFHPLRLLSYTNVCYFTV